MICILNRLKKPVIQARNAFRTIYEHEALGKLESRVDTQKKCIPNVKLVGIQSVNIARALGFTVEDIGSAADECYSYAEEALVEAIPMYEGARVFDGHTPCTFEEGKGRQASVQDRPNEQLLGWIQGVKFVPGEGLFGDFYYLESNPTNKIILESSDRNPEIVAMSHEANFGDFALREGRLVITKIARVKGLAVTNSRPGTTLGLFENQLEISHMKTFSIRACIDAVPATDPLKSFLVEMGAMDGMDTNAPAMEASDTDPAPTGDQNSRAAIVALLEQVINDSSLQVPDMMKKLKSIVEAHVAVHGPAGGDTGAGEGSGSGSSSGSASEDGEPDGDEGGAATESNVSAKDQAMLDEKTGKKAAMEADMKSQACKKAMECSLAITNAGLKLTPTLMEMVIELSDEKRTKFLEEMKLERQDSQSPRPKAGSAHNDAPTQGEKKPAFADPAAAVKHLRS